MRYCPRFPGVIPLRELGHLRVTHPDATVVKAEALRTVRLALIRHAASVNPEPGSNSPYNPNAPEGAIEIGFPESLWRSEHSQDRSRRNSAGTKPDTFSGHSSVVKDRGAPKGWHTQPGYLQEEIIQRLPLNASATACRHKAVPARCASIVRLGGGGRETAAG